MSLLPVELVTEIKTVWLWLGLPEEKDEIDHRIQSRSVLLFRVMRDIDNVSGKIYRVVEFGCGDNVFMFHLVTAIALIKHKKLLYVGIDKNAEMIARLDKGIPDPLKGSCQFIAADGSDVKWMEKIGNPKFHTAIFINPIVEDPDVAAKEAEKKYGIVPDAEILASRAKNGPKLREQYNQFTRIFKEVLKSCLLPSASLLIETWYEEEYTAVLKTLSSLAEDLPHKKNVPSHHCLAVTFKPRIKPRIKQ